MKPFPISVQLYSVREEAKKDFPAVLKKIADIGYAGVEFAGLQNLAPAEARKILDDLGMVTSSIHGGLPTPENVNEIVDQAKTLGYTRYISVFGPPDFETKEKVIAAAEKAQQAAKLLKPHGLTYGIHNHWWEFDKQYDGVLAHRFFMDRAPDVFAQIDTYWVKVGGADPAEVVRFYGERAPLLHIKDGPAVREQAMTAVGRGIMDWSAVIGAAAPTTEWIVVELDRCDTDMMTAVAESFRYLVDNGFGTGRG